MKIIFSPTKLQKINSNLKTEELSVEFAKEVSFLINILSKKTKVEIKNIFKASEKVTVKTFEEYRNFNNSVEYENAINLFSGTSFQKLDIENYDQNEISYLKKHLRIMSGLYGVLKPFDVIKKYRLDLDNRIFLETETYKNLTEYWSDKIINYFKKEDFILNLASDEYSKTLKKRFPEKIHNIYFEIYKDKKYKTVAMYSKQERGKMLNFMIKNQTIDFLELKKYSSDGFLFNSKKSTKREYYFTRHEINIL